MTIISHISMYSVHFDWYNMVLYWLENLIDRLSYDVANISCCHGTTEQTHVIRVIQNNSTFQYYTKHEHKVFQDFKGLPIPNIACFRYVIVIICSFSIYLMSFLWDYVVCVSKSYLKRDYAFFAWSLFFFFFIILQRP